MSQLPKPCAPLVPTVRHDIYEATSPAGALKNSASGLSVLVTGSGRGVGRATALAFAQAGAKKLVLTSRTQDELDEVKGEIEKLGKSTEVRVITASLTDEESVDKLFKEAGEVDVLVNNAGYLEPCVPIRDSNPSDWIRTMEININGTYLATRAFLRAAHAKGLVDDKSKRLTIINTSSIGSIGTRPGFSGYQPGKTMINRFTEFIHFEEPSVRTFAIHPGGVMTKLARDSMPPETHSILCDTPELSAGFSLWLATQDKADFLRGRYCSSNWDVDELLAKKDEIISKDLLWTRVIGQEQVMPK
ncbi:hypothetical protein JCM21900_005735 [Sporobolomyces salmonicolor]